MTAADLRALHHGPRPLILPNAWDVVSAQVVAGAGFPAIATSSAAIARVIGYDDGERTPPDEMFAAIARIARAIDVPVTADVEAGYGLDPKELVDRLLDAGAVGCNLEDSSPATGGLRHPSQQADFLAEVRAAAGADLVINARVDVFLPGRTPSLTDEAAGPDAAAGVQPDGVHAAAVQPDAVHAAAVQPDAVHAGGVDDAIARGRLYRRAGADCVYPILAPLDLLEQLASAIGGPLNAHAAPGGPTPADLIARGATRISYGATLHTHLTDQLHTFLTSTIGPNPPSLR